jgi:DNA primase
MSWDYNFFSPENNNLQSPNNNIRYIVRTTAVKWWDKYTYDYIITKINKLCTEQFLASNQFLVKKNINQAKLVSSSSKHEFKKHLLETLSQLSDDEDENEDEPVLAGYAQDPYADLAL